MKKVWLVLAVVALAVIAVPSFFYCRQQYRIYRIENAIISRHEANTSAQVGIMVAITAMESLREKNATYAKTVEELKSEGLFLDSGVEVEIVSSNPTGYLLKAYHRKGDKIFRFWGPGEYSKIWTTDR